MTMSTATSSDAALQRAQEGVAHARQELNAIDDKALATFTTKILASPRLCTLLDDFKAQFAHVRRLNAIAEATCNPLFIFMLEEFMQLRKEAVGKLQKSIVEATRLEDENLTVRPDHDPVLQEQGGAASAHGRLSEVESLLRTLASAMSTMDTRLCTIEERLQGLDGCTRWAVGCSWWRMRRRRWTPNTVRRRPKLRLRRRT